MDPKSLASLGDHAAAGHFSQTNKQLLHAHEVCVGLQRRVLRELPCSQGWLSLAAPAAQPSPSAATMAHCEAMDVAELQDRTKHSGSKLLCQVASSQPVVQAGDDLSISLLVSAGANVMEQRVIMVELLNQFPPHTTLSQAVESAALTFPKGRGLAILEPLMDGAIHVHNPKEVVILDDTSDTWHGHLHEANLHHAAGRTHQAGLQYAHALQLVDQDGLLTSLLTNLSACHLEVGQPLQALAWAATALSVDKQSHKAWYRAALALDCLALQAVHKLQAITAAVSQPGSGQGRKMLTRSKATAGQSAAAATAATPAAAAEAAAAAAAAASAAAAAAGASTAAAAGLARAAHGAMHMFCDLRSADKLIRDQLVARLKSPAPPKGRTTARTVPPVTNSTGPPTIDAVLNVLTHPDTQAEAFSACFRHMMNTASGGPQLLSAISSGRTAAMDVDGDGGGQAKSKGGSASGACGHRGVSRGGAARELDVSAAAAGRDQGDGFFQAQRFDEAARCYLEGLGGLAQPAATILADQAAFHLNHLGSRADAILGAYGARHLNPALGEAHHLLACALGEALLHPHAAAACEVGLQEAQDGGSNTPQQQQQQQQHVVVQQGLRDMLAISRVRMGLGLGVGEQLQGGVAGVWPQAHHDGQVSGGGGGGGGDGSGGTAAGWSHAGRTNGNGNGSGGLASWPQVHGGDGGGASGNGGGGGGARSAAGWSHSHAGRASGNAVGVVGGNAAAWPQAHSGRASGSGSGDDGGGNAAGWPQARRGMASGNGGNGTGGGAVGWPQARRGKVSGSGGSGSGAGATGWPQAPSRRDSGNGGGGDGGIGSGLAQAWQGDGTGGVWNGTAGTCGVGHQVVTTAVATRRSGSYGGGGSGNGGGGNGGGGGGHGEARGGTGGFAVATVQLVPPQERKGPVLYL